MILGNVFYVILKIKAQDTEELKKIIYVMKKELCPCGKDKKTNKTKTNKNNNNNIKTKQNKTKQNKAKKVQMSILFLNLALNDQVR